MSELKDHAIKISNNDTIDLIIDFIVNQHGHIKGLCWNLFTLVSFRNYNKVIFRNYILKLAEIATKDSNNLWRDFDELAFFFHSSQVSNTTNSSLISNIEPPVFEVPAEFDELFSNIYYCWHDNFHNYDASAKEDFGVSSAEIISRVKAIKI